MLGLCLLSVLAFAASPLPTGSVEDATAVRAQPEQRIVGTVEQVRPLPAPQDGMLEVFIRDAGGQLLIAIVPAAWGGEVVVGRRIDFTARPDGTHSYRDRAGSSRTVQRVKAVEAPAGAESGVDDLTLMLGILLLLMAGFGVLALLVARSRTSRRSVEDVFEDEWDESAVLDEASDEPPLPADPAQAMAEMMRRAEADEP